MIDLSVGSVVSIALGRPAADTVAGYSALTFTEVGEVGALGEFGGQGQVAEFIPIDSGVVAKRRGSLNYGTVALTLANDYTDAGQAALASGFDGANAGKRHSVKIVQDDGATIYAVCVVVSYRINYGDANQITGLSVALEIVSKPLHDSGVFTIEYRAGAGGQVLGQPVQAIVSGEDGAHVYALASGGYAFSAWSDGLTDNPRYEIAVTASGVFTARFVQAVISCAYPLDIEAGESPYGLMTMTEADTVGSATMVGSPVADPLILFAAPAGLFTMTAATIDFSTGVRVIEHQDITIPAAVDLATATEAYLISGSEYTTALDNVVTWMVAALQDGTFNIRVLRGAGLSQVHNSTVATPPSLIATIYDANTGTFSVEADGVPLSLSNDTYTPGEFFSIMSSAEDSSSQAGDAGKVLSAKKVTQAADMIGTYASGTTDPCGNEI